jgi:hypothetical protein
MASCPNYNAPEFVEIEALFGRTRSTLAFHKNNEVIPSPELAAVLLGMTSPAAVNTTLKIVEALGTDKVQKLYDKFYKNNPEKFYSELTPLAGKQQVEILKDYNNKNFPTSLQDMLTGIMAEMSYIVEVNTAKEKPIELFQEEGKWIVGDSFEPLAAFDTKEEAVKYREDFAQKNTAHYSNLTVPGGTAYTENEISTPGITPSIKGHAQFSTDNGIGWFRSDEQNGTNDIITEQGDRLYSDKPFKAKTRRILELQSDLFQKGRERQDLSNDIKKGYKFSTNKGNFEIVDADATVHVKNLDTNEVFYMTRAKFISDYKERTGTSILGTGNQFLQLLNKDGNWIPFFIKTIVQSTAKETVMEVHPDDIQAKINELKNSGKLKIIC